MHKRLPAILASTFALALLSSFLAAPAIAQTVTVTAADPVDAGTEAATLDAAPAASPGSNGVATSPGLVTHDQVADPLEHPGQVLKQIIDEKDHGGLFAAGILLLYVLGAVLVRGSGHVGWLAKGRTLAALVGIVGVLGSCVDKLAEHSSWQTVMAAAATALGTWLVPLHPNKADGSATADGTPTGLQPKIPGAAQIQR